MAYSFGSANANRIDGSNLTGWTTKASIAVRIKLNAASSAQRGLLYTADDKFFFDFETTGTNSLRIGYKDNVAAFPLITWVSGFTAGSEHVVVAVIDTTIGSDKLKLYADTSSTPKTPSGSAGTPGNPPNSTSSASWKIGGDGTTLSADGVIYEVAYWANVALTGSQAAALGAKGQMASSFPLPTHYWPLVSDAVALYGGQDGTATGASVTAHTNGSWFPPAAAPTPIIPTMWFAPDLGTTDSLDLFSSPAGWATIRKKVTAYKFFEEHVVDYLGSPPSYIGSNTLQNFAAAGAFSKLAGWGIRTAVESTVIAVPDGSFDTTAAALGFIGNILSNGGTLPLLDCDTTRGRGVDQNGLTQAQTVTRFKDWCDAIAAVYPAIRIGDIMPIWSSGDATLYAGWIDACLAGGVPLKWVTFDTTPTATARSECATLLAHCHGLTPSLPVQIIINPGIANSVEPNDATYCSDALAMATDLQAAISTIDAIEVQSWYYRTSTSGDRDIPLNLPEGSSNTHTKLMTDIASLFSVRDVPRGGTGLLLMGVG